MFPTLRAELDSLHCGSPGVFLELDVLYGK
jgi:hypothetical protein